MFEFGCGVLDQDEDLVLLVFSEQLVVFLEVVGAVLEVGDHNAFSLLLDLLLLLLLLIFLVPVCSLLEEWRHLFVGEAVDELEGKALFEAH